MKLVDLYLKPLEGVEYVLGKFTLKYYERWDKESGKWVPDPTMEVDPGDALQYRMVSLFLAIVFTALLIALIGAIL